MSPFVLPDCCRSASVLQTPETSGMKTREDSTGLHIRRNQGHVLRVCGVCNLTQSEKKKNRRRREYIEILCPDAQSFLPTLSANKLLTPHTCLQGSAVLHFSTLGSDEA